MANMDETHKQHVLGALDHIDGLLGDFMHQARQKTGEVRQSVSQHENSEMQDPNKPAYEGKDQPGGHTGHPFGGSKDQHGANNNHFEGACGEGESAPADGSGINISKRKSDGGMNALKALMSK